MVLPANNWTALTSDLFVIFAALRMEEIEGLVGKQHLIRGEAAKWIPAISLGF